MVPTRSLGVNAKESSVAQYNHALKHFEPFAASRGETVEACMAFVSADGTINDDTLKAFNAFLTSPARVSASIYTNCIKWMQHTLVLSRAVWSYGRRHAGDGGPCAAVEEAENGRGSHPEIKRQVDQQQNFPRPRVRRPRRVPRGEEAACGTEVPLSD